MADLIIPAQNNLLGNQQVVNTAITLATSGTITTSNNGVPLPKTALTTGGAVTAIVLQTGVIDNQSIEIINTSANSITFAAVGTSNVADGTSAVIAANTRMRCVWDLTAAKWYHGN